VQNVVTSFPDHHIISFRLVFPLAVNPTPSSEPGKRHIVWPLAVTANVTEKVDLA